MDKLELSARYKKKRRFCWVKAFKPIIGPDIDSIKIKTAVCGSSIIMYMRVSSAKIRIDDLI